MPRTARTPPKANMPITVKWMTVIMTQEPRRKQVKKEMMK